MRSRFNSSPRNQRSSSNSVSFLDGCCFLSVCHLYFRTFHVSKVVLYALCALLLDSLWNWMPCVNHHSLSTGQAQPLHQHAAHPPTHMLLLQQPQLSHPHLLHPCQAHLGYPPLPVETATITTTHQLQQHRMNIPRLFKNWSWMDLSCQKWCMPMIWLAIISMICYLSCCLLQHEDIIWWKAVWSTMCKNSNVFLILNVRRQYLYLRVLGLSDAMIIAVAYDIIVAIGKRKYRNNCFWFVEDMLDSREIWAGNILIVMFLLLIWGFRVC